MSPIPKPFCFRRVGFFWRMKGGVSVVFQCEPWETLVLVGGLAICCAIACGRRWLRAGFALQESAAKTQALPFGHNKPRQRMRARKSRAHG